MIIQITFLVTYTRIQLALYSLACHGTFGQTFYIDYTRNHQKIPYNRRDYEPVDEKNLSQVMSRKTTKKIQAVKG